MSEPLDAKELGDLISEDFDNFRDEHFVNWEEVGRRALKHTAYAEMLAALKYARRFLKPADHDVAFVDAAIALATGEQP